MRLLKSPYRWTWRAWWRNFDHWRWDIINGVGNLATFFEAVWWFRSWDWTGMLRLLALSAREMERTQSLGRHMTYKRDARRLLVVRELCRRLLEEEYSEGFGNAPAYQRFQHAEYLADQDVAYLCRTLRFVRHWWA